MSTLRQRSEIGGGLDQEDAPILGQARNRLIAVERGVQPGSAMRMWPSSLSSQMRSGRT